MLDCPFKKKFKNVENLLALIGIMLAGISTVEEFSIEQLDSDHSKNELNTGQGA